MHKDRLNLAASMMTGAETGAGGGYSDEIAVIRNGAESRNLWEIQVDGSLKDIVDASAFRSAWRLAKYIERVAGGDKPPEPPARWTQ